MARGLKSVLADVAPFLGASANERLKQIPVRVLLAGLITWSLYSNGNAALIPFWLIATGLVQAFEVLAFRPFRRARDGQAAPNALPAVASIILMSTIHAVIAGLLCASGEAILVAVGLLILCGGLLNNVASAMENRPLFVIGATPYLLVIAVLPVLAALSGHWSHMPLLLMTVALFFYGMRGAWARTHAAHRSALDAREQAEHRLQQAEAAMADRAAMAAIVSHELRTPVSAILAGAHVIRHGGQPDATPATADLIIDAGKLMTSMLNDLLDHSKMEARRMSLETRDFDMTAFIEDVVRFWSAPAAEKGLTLKTLRPGADAVWLKGDPYRLRQILNNLMSNAVKFTPAGGIITLDVELDQRETDCGIRLTVRDQGAGIAPEAMARLFTPFAQGATDVARTYGGTGLGLAVSRDLAHLMGGDVTVESRPGNGAAFTLDLVLPVGVETPDDDAFTPAAPDLERRIRVLAVDDHEINRRTLALVLQPLDVDLTTASDGATALELLAVEAFDVVLMDVNMPGLDGNETTRRLRASGGLNAGVPVIGFSAGTEAAQIEACRAAGMSDWLPKPLEPRRLYLALETAMNAAEACRSAA